ncbi:hypothetical protein [Phytohabitans aurantiacus]|uniref:Glycosyltransferase 2-like domain-containing protein n=1 Tax=Phytohabitans aurantiacus TaxID=3016789 RepID=A0ABQ5QK28_9ACTN|nr:hypothetical protein [Phytohabitans aurantiacus]GLH94900.1 hypothetical protein Pa4123_01720 [Phytohabitans aurantiacus]
MSLPELLIVVPTRGRPQNIRRMLAAWTATGAQGVAELLIAWDADDPAADQYADIAAGAGLRRHVNRSQTPMVPTLEAALAPLVDQYPFLGCFGDDHLPRSAGWAAQLVDGLRHLGTGIVYGNDLHRGPDLPTAWAMTADIVRLLGRMVPAPVEHLYSDRSVLDLGRAARCIRYLPDTVIEHLHYAAHKAVKDAGYQRVNAAARYRADRVAYLRWRDRHMQRDVATIRRHRSRS